MSLHFLYTYTGRPPLEDLHRGNCTARMCALAWALEAHDLANHFTEQRCWNYGDIDSSRESWTVCEPVWVLFKLICLNGVHVEAQGLNNHCSDFGYSIYNASVEWGRPFHSSTMIWRLTKVCALCMCCDVISLSCLLISFSAWVVLFFFPPFTPAVSSEYISVFQVHRMKHNILAHQASRLFVLPCLLSVACMWYWVFIFYMAAIWNNRIKY